MEILSFDEFAEQLRNFTSWGNRSGNDFGGAAYLLGACLDNIQKNAQQTELEELAERLDISQFAFLKKLAEMKPRADP